MRERKWLLQYVLVGFDRRAPRHTPLPGDPSTLSHQGCPRIHKCAEREANKTRVWGVVSVNRISVEFIKSSLRVTCDDPQSPGLAWVCMKLVSRLVRVERIVFYRKHVFDLRGRKRENFVLVFLQEQISRIYKRTESQKKPAPRVVQIESYDMFPIVVDQWAPMFSEYWKNPMSRRC